MVQKTEEIVRANTPSRFILLVSWPYARYVFGALSLGAFASAFGSFTPYVYKNIVDAITAAQPKEIYLWVFVYIGFYIFGNLLWRAVSMLGAHWAIGARHTGRMSLTEYVLGHSHQYFENRFSGSVASKIDLASDGSHNVINSIMFDFWPLAVSFVVSLGLAYATNQVLAGVFVLWIGVTVPVNYVLARRRITHAIALQRIETKVRGMTIDVLGNIRAVREYARERDEAEALGEKMEERRSATIRYWYNEEKMMGVNFALQGAFMAGMLFFAIHLAALGAISYGGVILILSLVVGMAGSIFSLGQRISGLSEQWGEISEGLRDLLVPYELPTARAARRLRVDFGSIAFAKATFRYPDGEPVLENFSFTIAPTEKVGIVGRSGAGKSTLIKLLLRHYDLTSGSLLVDGQDISKVTQASVRESIAVVPQEPLLFHRSIRENIAYGKPDASFEEIVEAAKLAHAHEFITRLPQGYETLVGERGMKLSGGERQRIALARAILKPARILVLDEATSALDSESEAAVQEALHTLMGGKTVIAVAHRLSTLREMDRILVLDHGKIVEDGTHHSLIKKGGIYAELWAHQSGGYLEAEPQDGSPLEESVE